MSASEQSKLLKVGPSTRQSAKRHALGKAQYMAVEARSHKIELAFKFSKAFYSHAEGKRLDTILRAV